MTFVVTENCIKCKYTTCVDVCPVDCFYEGATMLVIHPSECIDCGVCVPECPADAIVADTDATATQAWLDLNRVYSELWPNIMTGKSPLPDADIHNGRPGKLAEFSAESAATDDPSANTEKS
jgi:ferredoxin